METRIEGKVCVESDQHFYNRKHPSERSPFHFRSANFMGQAFSPRYRTWKNAELKRMKGVWVSVSASEKTKASTLQARCRGQRRNHRRTRNKRSAGRKEAGYARRDSITIDRPTGLLRSGQIPSARDKAARFVRFLQLKAISLGYV